MKVGTKVRIKGLVKAAKHNGKTGLVIKASAPGNGRRLGVKLQDGSGAVLAVKIENLEKVQSSAVVPAVAKSSPKGPELPKERALKRNNGLLREFDGNPDPNVLVLYYHFRDAAFDCFNAVEYNEQMLRYYEKDLSVKLVVPRTIGNNEYALIGLQRSELERNSLCEVAFNCGRSFTGISMLVKKRCFACHKPMNKQSAWCEGCRCVCFCPDPTCIERHKAIRTEHEALCQKIDLAKIVVEKENIQLL